MSACLLIMSVCLLTMYYIHVCLSAHNVCLSAYNVLYTCLFVCLQCIIYMSVCLFIMSVCLLTMYYIHVCLSVHNVCLSAHNVLYTCLFVCSQCTYLSVCLFQDSHVLTSLLVLTRLSTDMDSYSAPHPQLLPPLNTTLVGHTPFYFPMTLSPRNVLPGGRGTLREVFLNTNNLDTVESSARSEYNIEYERLFIFSYLDRPDFGETEQFSQKFSGFFVPPQSSLYTFNLRSDDHSRLFLSTNASTELAERIINVNRHTQFRLGEKDITICMETI